MKWIPTTLLLAGCAAVPATVAPVTGDWGGQHVEMRATSVAVSFEFDCAGGRIDAPLVAGPGGKFAVQGVYFPGHGGPERVDEIPRALPAIYSGSIQGDEMHFSIAVSSTAQAVGPFALRRGEQPRLFRCL